MKFRKKIIDQILGYIYFVSIASILKHVKIYVIFLHTPQHKLSLSTDFAQKQAKHKNKSYMNDLNQHLHEKHHKNEINHVYKRQYLLPKICKLFDRLTCRTEKKGMVVTCIQT